MQTARQQGVRLGAEDEGLTGARTGAPANVFPDEWRRGGIVGASGARQRCRVAERRLGTGHVTRQALQRDCLTSVEHRLERDSLVARGRPENLDFVLLL